ncbi:hypothetical protein PR202_ga03922 [Eleusine coracana subsp. coracana]|uniref:Uncharacterized protein n=1 Tax=Eleusine coracana subsp. coracana TaxID=191504 RepID=A0AAV5BN99_ELECO|nr:hypothetical protein PR202_ga03922 [Eleusine coracana subsp. coracana]
MEEEEEGSGAGNPPPPASSAPAWLLLDRFIHRSRRRRGVFEGDPTTSEMAYDCVGCKLRVSVRIADPPMVSRLYLHWMLKPPIEDVTDPACDTPGVIVSADKIGKRNEKENSLRTPPVSDSEKTHPTAAAPPDSTRAAWSPAYGQRPLPRIDGPRARSDIPFVAVALSETPPPPPPIYSLRSRSLSLPLVSTSAVVSAPHRLAATAHRSPSQASGSNAGTTRRPCTCPLRFARPALGDRHGSSPAPIIDPEPFLRAAFTPRLDPEPFRPPLFVLAGAEPCPASATVAGPYPAIAGGPRPPRMARDEE